MMNFLKGIIVGLGGIAPGLSGSVLLIIFGLYQRTLEALGSLLTNFKKNISFLLPLVAGMFTGVLLFSKLIDFLLEHYEVPTRFCFLGLIVGTLPMVWKEVRKEGFSCKYYFLILLSAVAGTALFSAGTDRFPQISDPTLIQSILLGVAVAATAIIPGVDPAVFLSTLGFYKMYVGALANLEFQILIPMVGGLAIGAMVISLAMSILFKYLYTATYSIIFGIFISMIPNILTPDCITFCNFPCIILMILGILLSFYLGDVQRHNIQIKAIYDKIKRG